MDFDGIVKREDRYRRKIDTMWEIYGHKYLKKYYKFANKSSSKSPQKVRVGSVFLSSNPDESLEYIYIYKIKGKELTGIRFLKNNINIYHFGIEYFPDDYVEITKEEFDMETDGIIERFHFDEIFNL